VPVRLTSYLARRTVREALDLCERAFPEIRPGQQFWVPISRAPTEHLIETITMNTFQKTLITAILFSVFGISIYQAVQTSKLRNEVQTLQQQKSQSKHQIAELETSLATAKAQLTKAQEDNDRLTAQARRLAKRDSVRQPTVEAPAKPTGLAALFGGDVTNGMFGAMGKMMEVAMQEQLDGKMSALKTRLNLTSEQETSIREILAKQSKAGSDMVQQMFSGGGLKTNDLTNVRELTGDAQIKALLTPEQAAAYDAFQKEEQNANLRLIANSELLQLQSALQLDETQQDKVFTVLADQAQAQFMDPQTNAGSAIDFRGMLQRKADALRPVLTPDQFERYQKFQQQQLNMIQTFTAGAAK
jgi:hypothetical protein